MDLVSVAIVFGCSSWVPSFLADVPAVEHHGGHRYRVDGRDVDLGPVAEQSPGYIDWLPA